MERKIYLGECDGYGNGRKICKAFLKVRLDDEGKGPKFAASAEIWNAERANADIIQGGQCVDTVAAMFPENAEAQEVVRLWKRWHLNDMRAECEHQRALGWTYDEHHGNNPEAPYEGDACPECGYHIGSAWLTETVPDQAIEFVRALPDTDRQPNWV